MLFDALVGVSVCVVVCLFSCSSVASFTTVMIHVLLTTAATIYEYLVACFAAPAPYEALSVQP